MKKKVLLVVVILVVLILVIFGGVKIYKKWQIDHAVIKVQLVDNLDIEVYSNIKLSDLIKSLNGTLEKNSKIKTTKLGKQEITFNYTNDDNIKVPYTFYINVVDTTKPIISMYNSYSLNVGDEVDLAKEFFCGDNYDDNPKCVIEGDYDTSVVGSYPVTFKAEDNSGNTISHDFILYVKEKPKNTSSNEESIPVTTAFTDIVQQHKTNKTKIGIDVSHWQGDIDYSKVKKAGVEFAFIRVGSQKGIKGEYQEFNLSFYHLTEMANAFIKTVEDAGYEGMLYSSKNYLENIWYETNHPVWLAHYTNQTNYEGNYKFWQLCSNGVVDGIDDNMVDIDIMY